MRRGDAPGQVRGGPQFQLEIIMEIHVRDSGGGGDGGGIYFGFTARTLIRASSSPTEKALRLMMTV